MSDRNGNTAFFQYARRVHALALLSMVAVVPLCGQDIHPWLAGSGGAIYYNGGNVGIGLVAPRTTLDVAGPIAVTNSANIGTTDFTSSSWAPWGGGVIGWNKQAGAGEMSFVSISGGGADGGFSFYDMNTQLLRILKNGNVGIGTAAPTAKLDAQTGTIFQTAARVSHTGDGNNPGQVLQISNGYGVAAGAYEVMGVYGNNFGTNYFTVKDNGNVGIGTSNPTQKLSVNGTIRTKEVVVDTGWADYVFAPAYRVRPLSEVNAYIQQHQRLPDMPSAEEVREKGVGVGEMQVKLLAKIEELTLHMIQAEERSSRLEQENRELREENRAIQQRLGRIEAGRQRER